MKTNVGYSF